MVIRWTCSVTSCGKGVKWHSIKESVVCSGYEIVRCIAEFVLCVSRCIGVPSVSESMWCIFVVDRVHEFELC